MNVERLYSHSSILGEGLLWNEKTEEIAFVDIVGKKVLFLSTEGQLIDEISVPKMPGCIVYSSHNTLIIAAENDLYELDKITRQLHLIATYPEITFPLRFNDGKCDRHGRFILGTMYRDQSLEGAAQGGGVYSIDQGALNQLLSNQTIPNGLAWSENAELFYHIDTPTGTVVKYNYTTQNKLSKGVPCITIPEKEGSPDGMCIDTEGKLWIAHWGGYKVARYCPTTGAKLEEISVPAENVSCCAFGGKDLSTLYITTAQNDIKEGGEVYQCQTKYKGTLPFVYKK